MTTKRSARSIANAIKRGESSKEVSEKYGFDSVGELEEYIKQAYNDSDSLLSGLKKNDKMSQNRKNRTEEIEPQEVANSEPAPVPSLDEDLERLRDELTDEAIRLENEHKKIVRQRKEIVDDFTEIRREIKGLELKLKKEREKITKRETKANELGVEMNKISAKHSEIQAQLSSVKERIAEKNKLLVLVSGDGTIDVYQNNEPVEVSFDGWEKRRDFMFNDESGVYDELSKKQLGVLAKLYVLKERFPKFRFELTLDPPFQSLQKLF